jgi:uncharacterized membrane protein YhiD involved in acid resistance
VGTGFAAMSIVASALVFWVNLSLEPIQAEIEQVRKESELNDKVVKLELENTILRSKIPKTP